MKKVILFMILCALFFTSCTRYASPGQGGCYFGKRSFSTTKNVVKFR